MTNKELIEMLLEMDLDKEIRITKICMAMILTKNDIKETGKRIEIRSY